MDGVRKKKLEITQLEKRLMLDATLGALVSTTVFAENTVNTAPQILDSDVSVTGTTTNFDGESLTISTTGGAEDQLSVNNEGSAAGQIGFDGTNVTYGGTVIGLISSDGSNGTNLTIDLDADATQAALERLIENITYQNTSDNPATNRTLNISVGALFSNDMTVTVVGQNEAPSINTNSGLTANEGATTVITSGVLGISDPDHADTDVTFTIDSDVVNGRIELSTNAGVAITSFTLDELNSGLVRYVHDGSETTNDSFVFTVSDGSLSNSGTFAITVTPVNDLPTIDTNTGTTVFQGFETTIGADEVPAQFGTVVLQENGAIGNTFNSFNGLINNNSSQISIIFTTPAATPTGTPGQVIYETGGSGRGIALILGNTGELEWHMATATTTPRLASGVALTPDTQYAVIMEMDQDSGEVRMHYQAAGNFNWFEIGRTAEVSTAWSDWNLSGGNNAAVGQANSSIGGYNGSTNGTTFEGSIDSDLIVTRFPSGGTTFINTKLIASDAESVDANLVYTITTDVQDGQLYNDDVAIGLNDTFTQADLDSGLITYTHGGAADASDSFIFSVSDGSATLTGQTYNITVDLTNTAPVLPDQVLQIAEDAANADTVGTLDGYDPDVGQTITYEITGGTGAAIFDIDAATGEITVLDNTTLDYETTTSYTLTVQITDDAPTPSTASRTFTIDILDVNENIAPTFPAQGPFSINEDAANNDTVGTVTATDADGDNVSYSITSGNTGNAFKINATTGEIQVRDYTQLDFETKNSYTLTIQATDDNAIPLSTSRNVTITIGDSNEGPSFAKENVIYYLDQSIQYSSATGNFYKYFNNNVDFSTALDNSDEVALNGVFGHMVTITSNAENNFVDSIISSHIWLAASDAGSEGQWIWIAGPETGQQFSQDGTAVNGLYEKWNGSEPNSGTGYNYAYMNTNSQWYDQNGNENRRYVIEWEGSEVINNGTYTINHTNADASDIANGTSVGFVQAGDAEGDTITYSITGGNADGIFEIDTNTGEILILDNTNLDASVQDTYTLTIQATESGGGLTQTADITINFNNALSLDTNNNLAVNENGSATITTATLNVIDTDTAATDIIFTITTQPAEGQIELSTGPGIQINSFTLDDLQNDFVVYVHGGSETITDSFEFSITDGASTSAGNSFNIDVNPQNDSPSITVNTGTTVLEGGSVTITSAMLDSLDADDTADGLTYTVSSLNYGYIEVSGVVSTTFTQSDIDAGNVAFIHDGSENNANFSLSLADGGEDSATTDTATFTLTRTPVNDSPTVSVNAGATVTEGATATIGSAELSATDIDDSDPTLVYTLAVIQNGQVELTTNPGVPVITITQDDLDNNRVVFRHDGSENMGSFQFSVADGGEDSAQPATGTFTFNIDPVNDSPLISTANATTVDAGNIVLIKKAVLNSTDPDDSGAGLIYTVDSTTNGQLELLGNPNVAVNTFTQADINNSQLVFRHDGTATITAQFQVTLADGGEDSATTDTATINLTVNNTNDSPTITLNAGATMDEGSALTITTAMLDSFDPDDTGTDLTWSISNLSANGRLELSTNPGAAITSFTQADLDAGNVVFIHDGGETTGASFDLELADGGENSATTDTATFNITVTSVNEGPQITLNTGATIAEAGNITITQAMLDSSDVDDTAAGLTYTASNFVNGSIEVSGVAGTTFTQADINNGDVVFIHDGNESAAASFDISLADGGENSSTADTGTFSLTVTPTNDSPSIGTNTGATMDEGGSLSLTTAMLNESDPDDESDGLTYTASNFVNGSIEVSGVAGTTFTQADIDAGRVAFIHDGSETVSASFDVSLIDGGENTSVAATTTFSMTVAPTNDAPTISTNIGAAMNEGGNTVLANTMLAATDIDNADSGLVFTITSLSAGSLENTDTATALGIGDTFTQGDLDNGFIRYTHDGSESTLETLRITLSDGAASTSIQTFNFTVTPVNDAPTGMTMSNDSAVENSAIGSMISQLNAIDIDVPGDTFTYTLLDDAGGMFAINGNNIVLMNTLDRAAADSHEIIVRVDDNNGGTFSQTFTINVTPAPEETNNDSFYIAPEEARRNTETPVTPNRPDEDIFTVGEITEPERRFYKDGFVAATYKGLNAFGEIFYGKASSFLNAFMALSAFNAPETQEHDFEENGEPLSPDPSQDDPPLEQPEKLTNIREVLAMLEAIHESETEDATSAYAQDDGFSALEREFEDVLTYHEANKAKLRSALLDSHS